nr:hypothetical protein [Tanacetum cinerariifolium]
MLVIKIFSERKKVFRERKKCEKIHENSEDDETISQTSTEGNDVNFNEVNSFPDDEFCEPRNSDTLCNANTEYFPYVPAFDRLSTNNHVSPEPIIISLPLVPSVLEDSSILDIKDVVLTLDETVHPESAVVSEFTELQYQANPNESHLVAVKRTFKYLKAEYVVAIRCCAQVFWIKSQLADYDVLYDKVSLHQRPHFKGDIELHFVPADLQLAGILTKPLVEPSFTRLVAELVKVEEETKTITFSFSWWDEPRSFIQNEFISAIGLPICKDIVPLPPKETVRVGLATLGLFDKDKPTFSSTVLVNSSPLKMNNDLTLVKPHTITTASFQKPLASEVALTSHMLKVAKLSQEPEQSLIPPSREVNADDTTDKSLSRDSEHPVTQPKAPIDLKTKKKRIVPSSKPKYPYKVRVILPKKQVVET